MIDDDVLLVLVCPVRRRDDVVDALMAYPAISGFTMSHCGGFSREHSRLSLREQVQGFGDFERFEVAAKPETIKELKHHLAITAGRDDFHYWIYPILEQGALRAPSRSAGQD